MNTELLANIQFALPEMIILLGAVLALLGDVFFPRRGAMLGFSIAMIALFASIAESVCFMSAPKTILFSGAFISDPMSCMMRAFIALTVAICLFYSSDYIEERGISAGDNIVLALLSTLGMMILVSAHTLLTLYLGLELMSLPLYVLTAIRRTETEGAEAALKYFVMGALASGMLLYGMSLIFGATGALSFDAISQALTGPAMTTHKGLFIFGLVFMASGISFKLALVPFHSWAPDVYEGAPTSSTLFISVAPKIAALGMAIRFFSLSWGELAASSQQILLVLALLSTGLGNVLAIVQTNIKRLFAYSAISHAGYAFFGLLAMTPEGYSAALYYILVYALMSSAGLGLIVLLSRNGAEITLIKDLKGLNSRNPWLAFMMLLVLFSMAGVPPLVGFLTKFLVLKALVDVGLTWVAVLGLLFAVVGAFYYLRVVKVMYFDEADEKTKLALPKSTVLIYSVHGLALLYLGLFPSALITLCLKAFA